MIWNARHAQRAVQLVEAGFTVSETCRVIGREFGTAPSWHAVKCWVDPEYRLRKQMRVADFKAKQSVATAKFRLPSNHPRYRAAFVRRLRDEGLPVRGIARVCRVVFGGRWDDSTVNRLLRETLV